MHRGYRFKLYPTADQAETLGRWVGVTRLVYNLALEQRRDFWRQFRANEGRAVSVASQGRELTKLRAENDWIAAVPQSGLEAALNDVDRAFSAFFNGTAKHPTPRKLGLNDSIRFRARECKVTRVNARWALVRVPRMGPIKVRLSRDVVGRLLTFTLCRRADDWSLTVGADIGEAPAMNALPAVGIDRGVATTLSLSSGEHIRLPDLSLIESKRRRAQKALARRKRGSRRYAKQRRSVARMSAKIARVRAHHLHIASRTIASRYGTVAIERLNIRGMTASASGTIEAPGRNVAQKRGLNRSILAQGWGIFAAQLAYKLEAAGGRLVHVPAPYTSQTCAECGVVDARSRKSQAVFECVACDHRDHADTNAARNILRGSTAFVEERRYSSGEARTLAA